MSEGPRLRDSGRLGVATACWLFFVIAFAVVGNELRTSPHVVGSGRVIALLVMGLFECFSVVTTVRMATDGVSITADRVIIRNSFKTYKIQRSDIVGVHRSSIGFNTYPGIHLRDGSLIKVDGIRGKDSPRQLAAALGVTESETPFHAAPNRARARKRILVSALADIVIGAGLIVWGAVRGLPASDVVGALVAVGAWPLVHAYRRVTKRDDATTPSSLMTEGRTGPSQL